MFNSIRKKKKSSNTFPVIHHKEIKSKTYILAHLEKIME